MDYEIRTYKLNIIFIKVTAIANFSPKYLQIKSLRLNESGGGTLCRHGIHTVKGNLLNPLISVNFQGALLALRLILCTKIRNKLLSEN